jgi:hypothetical protein
LVGDRSAYLGGTIGGTVCPPAHLCRPSSTHALEPCPGVTHGACQHAVRVIRCQGTATPEGLELLEQDRTVDQDAVAQAEGTGELVLSCKLTSQRLADPHQLRRVNNGHADRHRLRPIRSLNSVGHVSNSSRIGIGSLAENSRTNGRALSHRQTPPLGPASPRVKLRYGRLPHAGRHARSRPTAPLAEPTATGRSVIAMAPIAVAMVGGVGISPAPRLQTSIRRGPRHAPLREVPTRDRRSAGAPVSLDRAPSPRRRPGG